MNNNKHTTEGYRGPFLERSGESAASLVEVLLRPPECPLTEEEKSEAYQFETELFNLSITPDLTMSDIIKKHKGDDVVAPFVFAEAFLSGAIDDPQLPEFTGAEAVYKWFAERVVDRVVDTKTLLSLAKSSKDHYQKRMAESLVTGEEVNDLDATYMQIVLDPVSAIELARHTLLAREHLLNLRRDYHKSDEALNGAKRAVVDVYLARINSLVATDVPVMSYIHAQSELIGDEDASAAAHVVLPAAFAQALTDPSARERLFRRLDYMRNGMGLDAGQRASAVTAALKEGERGGMKAARFSPEQTQILKAKKLSPETMKDIFTNIVRRAGLLSGEDASTWTPARTVRASDGLFQVVSNPSGSAFAVDPESGVYRVATTERSLYDALVVGGFHELAHINQAEADNELGKKLKIAEVRGKRVSMLREGGANLKQREAELKFFGRAKPVALTYAKALNELTDGGSIVDATHAFFDEKLDALPDLDRKEAAAEAADRVLRLLRHGGVNSLSLSYAEEGILMHELQDSSHEAIDRATAITSLDLVDQVRLHRYGLLPEVTAMDIDWTEYIFEEMQPYIDEALRTTGQ